MQRILGFQKRRARDRVMREIAFLRTHLLSRPESDQSRCWYLEAKLHLAQAEEFIARSDADGGWSCLHATARQLILGMSPQEIEGEAIALEREADKLSHWRRDTIRQLLKEPPKLDATRLIQALKIRDDYYISQYHKVRLSSDQLMVLCCLSAVSVTAAIVALVQPSVRTGDWSLTRLIAVAAFGAMGSAFSVAQSIIIMADSAKVPEYVANYWVTAMRTLLGSTTGLAGYCFYLSKIITISLLGQGDPLAVALTVAFVFGYSGEKLISKIADSLSSGTTKKEK
jgi:hypothetical protein